MNIRSYLSQGKPLLFDGGMGTLFAARSEGTAEQCERANVNQPEEILAIHRAYLKAGCRAVKTNTFSLGTMDPCHFIASLSVISASVTSG